MKLLLTVYFTALGGLGLLIMLLAMTFNVGILAAILVGEVSAWVGGGGWPFGAPLSSMV
jgi:hypothetical protein